MATWRQMTRQAAAGADPANSGPVRAWPPGDRGSGRSRGSTGTSDVPPPAPRSHRAPEHQPPSRRTPRPLISTVPVWFTCGMKNFKSLSPICLLCSVFLLPPDPSLAQRHGAGPGPRFGSPRSPGRPLHRLSPRGASEITRDPNRLGFVLRGSGQCRCPGAEHRRRRRQRALHRRGSDRSRQDGHRVEAVRHHHEQLPSSGVRLHDGRWIDVDLPGGDRTRGIPVRSRARFRLAGESLLQQPYEPGWRLPLRGLPLRRRRDDLGFRDAGPRRR